jgi:hypothetical protein
MAMHKMEDEHFLSRRAVFLATDALPDALPDALTSEGNNEGHASLLNL